MFIPNQSYILYISKTMGGSVEVAYCRDNMVFTILIRYKQRWERGDDNDIMTRHLELVLSNSTHSVRNCSGFVQQTLPAVPAKPRTPARRVAHAKNRHGPVKTQKVPIHRPVSALALPPVPLNPTGHAWV
jgi:hypothetical protein